mmetsp:Transcript_50478/g.152020  ORF Transcript_50478/g.152020 Transcript_50478/m.152020 type:complete len:244 (+) Transcript_50478:82-813(+)
MNYSSASVPAQLQEPGRRRTPRRSRRLRRRGRLLQRTPPGSQEGRRRLPLHPRRGPHHLCRILSHGKRMVGRLRGRSPRLFPRRRYDLRSHRLDRSRHPLGGTIEIATEGMGRGAAHEPPSERDRIDTERRGGYAPRIHWRFRPVRRTRRGPRTAPPILRGGDVRFGPRGILSAVVLGIVARARRARGEASGDVPEGAEGDASSGGGEVRRGQESVRRERVYARLFGGSGEFDTESIRIFNRQ